jgi:hypothetical protein
MHLEHLNSLIISQTKHLRQVLQEFNSGTIRKEISKRGYTRDTYSRSKFQTKRCQSLPSEVEMGTDD